MLATETATCRFSIVPRGPFSWPAACDVVEHFAPLARHWRGSGEPLRLAFALDGSFRPVAVALRWSDDRLEGEAAGTSDAASVAAQVGRIFSLDHDGTGFPAVASRDVALAPLLAALPGLRPVCFPSPYECAAWAVLSQRISMAQAAAIQERLVRTLGSRLDVGGGEAWAFPGPARLLELDVLQGLSPARVVRLHGVAQAALDGLLDAERLRAMPEEAATSLLRTIPGIGPFWASGIYLRGCGIVDAATSEPLSVAALARLHGLGDALEPEEQARLTEAHRPFRMWVTFLLRVAAARGLIPGVAGREGEIRRRAGRRTARGPATDEGSSRVGQIASIGTGLPSR